MLLVVALAAAPDSLAAQHPDAATMQAHHPGADGDNRVWGANWQLAARFAPYKVASLTHSTSVSPQWIGETDRFWYQWENSDGTFYYIVDPARATKRQIFDNDRIAAELTRITRDPWDGQHLPIRNIEFIDENTIQFEVQSTQDEEIADEEAEVGRAAGGQEQEPPQPAQDPEEGLPLRVRREHPDPPGAGGLRGAPKPTRAGPASPPTAPGWSSAGSATSTSWAGTTT